MALLSSSCSKQGDYSTNFPDKTDPLHYVQTRPIAPHMAMAGDTGSMEPFIHAGDILRVDKIDIKDVEKGNVIEFWWGSRGIPAVHRVVDKFTAGNGEIGLVTKGDNNQLPDSFVTTKKDLIGIVTKMR